MSAIVAASPLLQALIVLPNPVEGQVDGVVFFHEHLQMMMM